MKDKKLLAPYHNMIGEKNIYPLQKNQRYNFFY